MKNIKKISLFAGSIAVVAAPVATVVSCGISPEDEKTFTVGFAIAPVSSLNYIKYSSSVPVASALVESLFKGGPQKSSAIANYLKLKNVFATSFGARGHRNLINYSYQTGTLRRSSGERPDNRHDSAAYEIQEPEKHGLSDKYVLNLNGKAKWASGEKLTSSNFIDSVVYTLDVNTGSQRLTDIYDLGIKHSEDFVDAQNQYAKHFGVTYKNPFGYKNNPLPKAASKETQSVWSYYKQMTVDFPLQRHFKETKLVEQEKKDVAEIQKYAKELGIYGDKYSSHPHGVDGANIGWTEDAMKTNPRDRSGIDDSEHTIQSKTGDMYPFKLDIQSGQAVNSFTFLINGLAMNSKDLIPVNRRFIESIGGIDNFGLSKDKILTEGPFTIKESVLGINGSMLLQKDSSYHLVKEVIPETVKLFFQQDPVITASLFEDGYISKAQINSVFTRKFFSNPKLRNLIQKHSGNGGTGFVFNLDKETNKNKALLNPHFRKALSFAVDREEMIKVSGFDTTIPSYSPLEATSRVNSWMAPDKGVSVGNAYVGETMKFSDTLTTPMISASSLDATGTDQLFSHPDQKDMLHSTTEAIKELEMFKADNPQLSSVTLNFTFDSSPMMQNMALAMKSQFKKVFGNYVNLVIKGLPKSIYDSYIVEGNFDVTWKNLDYLGRGNANSIDAYMISDGISKNDMKTVGFRTNPTGSWTLHDAFKYYQSNNRETIAQTKSRLKISDLVWDKIKELSTVPNIKQFSLAKNILLQKKKVKAFFNKTKIEKEDLPSSLQSDTTWTTVDSHFDTFHEIMSLVISANRIIMDQAPYIATFRVDVRISIDRLPGVNIEGAAVGYAYAYDLTRKPKADLPGLEVKGV